MSSWKRTGSAIVRLVFLVLLVLLLQLTVIHRIRIFGVGPDLSILLLVYLALWRGAAAGTAGGFLIGVLQGVSSPFHFGAHALAKSIVGFATGKLGPHVVRESIATQAAVIVGAQVLHDLILLPVVLNGAGSFFVVLATRTLPGALYSALLGCFVYRFILRPMGLDLRFHGTSIH